MGPSSSQQPHLPESEGQRPDVDEPPKLTIAGLGIFTLLSCGVFLWMWMVMQAVAIRKINPASKLPSFAWISVVPAALFYINLPSLILAIRQGDQTEIARLHIAMVLWGTIAAAFLIAALVWIWIEKRQQIKS